MPSSRPATAVVLLLLLVPVSAPAAAQEAKSPGSGKPRLVLDGPRAQLLPRALAARGLGMRFRFTARLEGGLEEPETFYCLDQIWDWGDGTESVHETDCDPYEDGAEVQRQFSGSHGYSYGRYAVRLRLVRGDETVIQGTLDIEVH